MLVGTERWATTAMRIAINAYQKSILLQSNFSSIQQQLYQQQNGTFQRLYSTTDSKTSIVNETRTDTTQKSIQGTCYYNLSFSGAGHLLPYHLGVCSQLIHRSSNIHISAVSGSSSGAICATLFSLAPHRIDEYAMEFIKKRGGGISLLKEILLDEQTRQEKTQKSQNERKKISNQLKPEYLYIATTQCSNASLHLFPFHIMEGEDEKVNDENGICFEKLMKCIQASCTIPNSFHPMDILNFNLIPSSLSGLFDGSLSYPNEEGIEIDGQFYIDGAISSPCPSPPSMTTDGIIKEIKISPLSYSANDMNDSNIFRNNGNHCIRVSPIDTSLSLFQFMLLPKKDVSIGTVVSQRLNVRPSIQNIRSMGISMGANVTSQILHDLWESGKHDAERVLMNHELKKWT